MKKFTRFLLYLFIMSLFSIGTWAQFTSTPDTTAFLGKQYSYTAVATGATSYTLEKSLTGMSITPTSGVITWTPQANTPGGKVIIKSDNQATQEFFVHMASGYKCLDGAVSYIKFDENTGTTFEDVYGSHDAVAPGAIPLSETGKVDNAVKVTNSYTTGMDIADHADFHWGAGASFSVSFWFKSNVEDRNSVAVIVGRNEGSAANHWWIGINEDNALTFYVRDADQTLGFKDAYLSGSRLYQNLNWHHVVAIRDAAANKLRLYFDGVLPADPGASVDYSGTSVKFDATTAAPLSVGYLKPVGSEGNYPMDGTIDELVVYNRALTPTEISDLFTKGNAGKPACSEGFYAPLIVTEPVVETNEDELYTYKMIVRDLDNDPISFNVVSKPTWIQTTTGSNFITLSETPSNDNVGSEDVEIEATAGGITVSQAFTLEVINVNDAPVITLQNDTVETTAGSTVAVPFNYLTVTDVDNDAEDLSMIIKDGTGYTHAGNNITLDANATGSVNVNVAVTDGTAESSIFAMYVKIKLPDDINDLQKIDSKYYPNPATDVVRFVMSDKEPLKLEIFDLTGKLVKTQLIEDNKTEVDISMLPSGLYPFKLSNTKVISTGKLAVE